MHAIADHTPRHGEVMDPTAEEVNVRSFFSKAADAIINSSTLKQEMQELRHKVDGLQRTIDTLVAERQQAIEERNAAVARAEQAERDLQHANKVASEHFERSETYRANIVGLQGELDTTRADRNTHFDRAEANGREAAHWCTEHARVKEALASAERDRDDARLALWAEQEQTKRHEHDLRVAHESEATIRDGLASRDERIAALADELAEWKHAADLATTDYTRVTGKLTAITEILTS